MFNKQTGKPSKTSTDENISGSFRKGIHYDVALEESIMGICLISPAAHSSVIPMLEPELFYSDQCRAICEAVIAMYQDGEQIDPITITHWHRSRGVVEIAGDSIPMICVKLMAEVVNDAHVETWCVILRQLYVDRELIRIRMTAGTGDGDSLEKAFTVQELLKKALNMQATDDWRDISEVMISLDKHREMVKGKELLGIPTSIRTLDRITAGFQATQLIVIGARPSVGKTAFIGAVVLHAAAKNYKVGVISLEMPEEQIGARMAAIYSDVEFWRIYRNRHTDHFEEKRLAESMSSLANLPIKISSKTNVSGSAIRSKAERLKKRSGLDLLIIDYLQLIEGEGSGKDGNREREVAKLSRSLKLLAMDLKIPVIILCQLNRESEKSGSKSSKPKMSQIRESGAIEQDADIVMLLHREWKSGNLTDEHNNSTEFQANIIVEKNRNGETRDISISFNPETMKFYEQEEMAVFEKPFSNAIADAGRKVLNDQKEDKAFIPPPGYFDDQN